MWNGKTYDEFQKTYQFQAGCYLLDKLENKVSLSGRSILDLGCGNGKLTTLLAAKSNKPVIAVDSDKSMLAAFKEKYANLNTQLVWADVPNWLSTQSLAVDVIFSNAVFHWFGSHQSIKQVVTDCYKGLSSKGKLALRFSLQENAYEIKRYLEEKLTEFLGEQATPYLNQSQLEFAKCLKLLEACGFTIDYSEEIRFTPFADPKQDFQFMVKSQPIQKYFTKQSFRKFNHFLEGCWQQKQVTLQSHHAVFIASK